MCNRFTVRTQAAEISKYLNTPGLVELQLALRFNAAPTQNILTIRNGENGREPAIMRWGLVPSWSKEFKTEFETFNAKSETAHEKPSYRSAMKKRHCLIPLDGYIEWKTIGKKKEPYLVTLKNGGVSKTTDSLFAFAGLWEAWNDKLSCTIMTTTPNEEFKSLHHRMPVILSPNDYDVWLNADNTDIKYLLEAYPASELKIIRISLSNFAVEVRVVAEGFDEYWVEAMLFPCMFCGVEEVVVVFIRAIRPAVALQVVP